MIRLESFYENRHELKQLTEDNSKEADSIQQPLNVNWEFYKLAEEMGMMFCFIDRGDEINGYINFTIQPHHHHQDKMYCTIDCLYVKPSARSGFLGIKLLKKAEELTRSISDNAVMVFGGQKVDITPIAKRLGYEQSEIIYRKVL